MTYTWTKFFIILRYWLILDIDKVMTLPIFLSLKGIVQKAVCKPKNMCLEYQVFCPKATCYVVVFIIWSDHVFKLSACISAFWFGIFFPPTTLTGSSFQDSLLQRLETSCNFQIIWTQRQFIAISSWVTPTHTYPYVASMDSHCSWIISAAL